MIKDKQESPQTRNGQIKVGGEILTHLHSPNYTKILPQKDRYASPGVNSQEVFNQDLHEMISVSNQMAADN